MDAVDRIGSYIHSALEAKSHICAPQIIVDGFGQRHYIQPFFKKQIRRFLAAVPPKYHQAIQTQFPISMFHGLYFIQTILIRDPHQFKRLPGCAKERPSPGQDTGKIRGFHHPVIRVNQPFIAVFKPDDLYIVEHLVKRFGHATHSCV